MKKLRKLGIAWTMTKLAYHAGKKVQSMSRQKGRKNRG